MRALIIEDDLQLQKQLQEKLLSLGYAVDCANNGEEGLHFANEYPIDVAIVDLGLPDFSGLEVIKKTRDHGKNFPILILTARGRWQEKVEGLEAGADDYLVKPFSMEELLARLRALLRRNSGFAKATIECGALSLWPKSQSVKLNNEELELTAFEYKILEYLMLNSGKVISKTELTEHVYDEDSERDSNVIEVFVSRLRQKLDPKGKTKPIETLRHRGYRFNWPRKEIK